MEKPLNTDQISFERVADQQWLLRETLSKPGLKIHIEMAFTRAAQEPIWSAQVKAIETARHELAALLPYLQGRA